MEKKDKKKKTKENKTKTATTTKKKKRKKKKTTQFHNSIVCTVFSRRLKQNILNFYQRYIFSTL